MSTLANNLAFHSAAVTASSSGTNPNFVLDGGSGQWSSVSNGLPAWLQFQLDRPILMTSYAVLPSNATYTPKDWTFSGSNDGTTWTQLDSRTGQTFATTSTWNTYTFTNTTAYLYYRFTFTAVSNSTATQVWVGEVELGGTVPNDITHNIIETVVSGVYSTGSAYAAANLYDHSVATSKGWVSSYSTSHWVRVKLDQPLALTTYTLWPDPSSSNKPPTAWTVSGSDDGVTWSPVDSRSAQTWSYLTGALGKGNTYTLVNRQGFLYYRFDFPSPTGSSFVFYLQELELVGQPGQPGFTSVPSADTLLTVPYWNDNFADAAPVVIPVGSTSFTSLSRSNLGHTIETGEPGGLYRSMWWVYKPLASGSATFDTQLTSGAYLDTMLSIYTGSALNALTLVASDDDSGGNQTSKVTYAVTAGTTYYIRVASYTNGTDSNYVLRVNGPISKTQQQVDAPAMQLKVLVEDGPRVYTDSPPAEVEVSSGAGVPPKNQNDIPPAEVEVSSAGSIPSKNQADIPPAEVEVSVSGGPITGITPPAMSLAAYLGKPTVTRVFRALLDPADNAVVPAVRPVLSVTIRVTEGTVTKLRLDVQYDDNAGFSDPTTLTRDVNVIIGENIVRVTTVADVAALTPQFWRARLTFLGQIFDWTTARQFTVDPTAGDHRAAITWSVTDGLTDPHLWFITPSAGIPGELVTVVGQGFSLDQGSVTLAGTPMPIQSWEHVPASAAVTTTDRVINLTTVDPEHDQVVVAVPDVASPGGQLAVSGS